MKVRVIGAGLAGTEAAYYLANKGIKVELYEQKPNDYTKAHSSPNFGELVCSNSLKSDSNENACGLLKYEMRALGSLTMEAANHAKLKAGQDLVVDREEFSKYITDKIKENKNISIISEKVVSLPLEKDTYTIIATGPLTDDKLLRELQTITGQENLHFYDSAAPLVFGSSLDLTKLYKKSRYDKGEGEYLNCPLSKSEYYAFVDKLVSSPTIMLHDFEHFEGCLPIEVMAKRGIETLRFGPLKAKGLELEDQTTPYAVIQLRQDDAASTLYNLVGFQTNLTFGAQKDLIQSLPGFENAKFARFGLMHRNTYLEAPSALNRNLSLKKRPDLKIAGQLSGVEGYVESAASGLLSAIYLYQELTKGEYDQIPLNTMLGSLINYLIMSSPKHFAPMNATYGILRAGTKDKSEIYLRSMEAIKSWKEKNNC